jgi:hypothetical protein
MLKQVQALAPEHSAKGGKVSNLEPFQCVPKGPPMESVRGVPLAETSEFILKPGKIMGRVGAAVHSVVGQSAKGVNSEYPISVFPGKPGKGGVKCFRSPAYYCLTLTVILDKHSHRSRENRILLSSTQEVKILSIEIMLQRY